MSIGDAIEQVQGGVWVTGRKWMDFCLYCPALEVIGREMTIIRVVRDDNYIEKMEASLIEFDMLVEDYKERLTA